MARIYSPPFPDGVLALITFVAGTAKPFWRPDGDTCYRRGGVMCRYVIMTIRPRCARGLPSRVSVFAGCAATAAGTPRRSGALGKEEASLLVWHRKKKEKNEIVPRDSSAMCWEITFSIALLRDVSPSSLYATSAVKTEGPRVRRLTSS